MTDTEFIRAPENCTLAEEEFRHAGHARPGGEPLLRQAGAPGSD